MPEASLAKRHWHRALVCEQNKAERKVTREQALLKKNPVAIKEELDKLEALGKENCAAAESVVLQLTLPFCSFGA